MARDNTMPSDTLSSMSEIKGATKRQEALIAYALEDIKIGFRFSWQTYRYVITKVEYIPCIGKWRVYYTMRTWQTGTGNFQGSIACECDYGPREFK